MIWYVDDWRIGDGAIMGCLNFFDIYCPLHNDSQVHFPIINLSTIYNRQLEDEWRIEEQCANNYHY